ncbi:MAG: hypothetical protein K2M95_06485 [Clostridiales bacterium]|nr:hypothetical protein [Clostridiales bacterium]
MANQAVDYIREAIDSILHGKENKKKRTEAQDNISEIIGSIKSDALPEKPELPDAPTYERLEKDERTDDELTKSAEDELAAYKAQGEKGIDKQIAAEEEGYRADMDAAQKNHDEAAESTRRTYESAKKNTDNDMLKRGLARSSIAANKKAALEQNEAEATAKLASALNEKLQALNERIDALAAKREEALNDFNLTYAAKLTERINELKKERDEKTEEAIKYNNSLTEKEHNAEVDKAMKESDLYGEALDQKKKEKELGSDADYKKIYDAVVSELRKINLNDARDIVLNNPDIRENVGNYYFYLLYDEFCR